MNIQIKNFKEKDEISGIYLLNQCAIKQTNKIPPKEYINIVLQDDTGTISGNLWSNLIERYSEEELEELKQAKAVDVHINVRSWNGRLMIDFIEPPKPVQLKDVPDLKALIPTTFLNTQQAVESLKTYIQMIENVKLQQVACDLIRFDWDAFKSIPAATSMHHAYVGGLITHTLGVIKAALKIASLYPDKEEINQDLLIVGAIAHDVTKTIEYEIDEFGLAPKFSIDGNLLGHPYMSARLVDQFCQDHEVDNELSIHLQHMVLSHHGKLEHGSPVTPKTLEAEILHLADYTDSRLEMFRKQLEDQEKGTLSETKVFGLENSFIYRKP